MIDKDKVELIVSEVVYLSKNDEAAFFEWLKKLLCVDCVDGRGRNLYIHVNVPNLDEDSLRELISLFKRYDIPMGQLSIFDNDSFAGWFRNEKADWYKSVFSK